MHDDIFPRSNMCFHCIPVNILQSGEIGSSSYCHSRTCMLCMDLDTRHGLLDDKDFRICNRKKFHIGQTENLSENAI
ncbi:hypothetical protein X975_10377, partial [Stegodyphus mimosarum]